VVKPSRREIALAGVAATLVAVWLLRRGGPQLSLARPGPAARPPAVEDVPRIDLARLKQPGSATEAGRRDLFAFGEEGPRPGERAGELPPTPPPAALRTPPPAESAAAAALAAGPPPFNVKYVGSVESKQGVRAAILLTDKKEILVGQQGDVVANRLRIVKIGYESVDVQDVGSEHVRRIPFKGN
jgi:hypothetical protein